MRDRKQDEVKRLHRKAGFYSVTVSLGVAPMCLPSLGAPWLSMEPKEQPSICSLGFCVFINLYTKWGEDSEQVRKNIMFKDM